MAALTRFLLVLLAAFFQLTNFFNIFGVKPNFSLAVLAAIAAAGIVFHEYILLVLLSAVLLKFNPGFDVGALVFAITAFTIFAANRYLPWNRFLNNFVLIIGATFLLQLMILPARINFSEIVYNLILSAVILIVLPKDNESR